MTAAGLHAVLDALPYAVILRDPDLRLVHANPAFWRLSGVPAELCPPGSAMREMVRILAYRGIYGPGDPEAQVEQVMALDRRRPTHRRLRMLDGRRTVDILSTPLPDGGVLTCAHEITDLMAAATAAQDRARLVETVLATMSAGVIAYGPDQRVVLSNPAAERISGHVPGAIRPGMTHRELLALRVAAGEFINADAAAEVAERIERDRAVHSVRQRVRPNGDVLRFESHPMPDGGFVVEVNDITALKRVEDEARRRAAVLDGVLEALPHGVVVFGPDRRALKFNAAYARIMADAGVQLGETVDELVARRRAAGEYDDETAAQVLLRYAPTAEGEAARRAGMSRIRPDGTVIENRMARLPDGGMISVFTDVTALHRAEAEARARAEMLVAVLEALPDGVVVFGPDRRARITNAAYQRIMGPAAARIGETMEELADRRVAMGDLTREMADALLRRHRGPAEETGRPIQRVRPDGTAIHTRAGRLPDGGHIAVISDITALHRAEETAQSRAAMLEAMLATIRHGIIMYGPDGRLMATNAMTAELTGMPVSQLVRGRSMDELIDGQVLRGQMTPAMAAWLKGLDRRRSHRYSRTRPDGRVIEISSDPTPDGGYVITYSDVTDDRRIRSELEAARAAAEAGSAAKSRFLATMSHELRTPLNAVIGFSEAIRAEQDRRRVEDYADAVNEAGRQLLLLIDDILDVARSQADPVTMHDEPVAVAPLLQTAARDAMAAARAAGLTLEVVLPEGLPALRGDARRLSQVLQKLMSNAVKFTPAGGRVSLSAAADAQGLTIRVADTGIGIPPEDRERSFEPFTQLDNSLARRFHGSGLGLHLARSLAVSLGGTLVLEDAEGPGIVAVLRFPSARLVQPAEVP
jgi:signal transduction histidine kinase